MRYPERRTSPYKCKCPPQRHAICGCRMQVIGLNTYPNTSFIVSPICSYHHISFFDRTLEEDSNFWQFRREWILEILDVG